MNANDKLSRIDWLRLIVEQAGGQWLGIQNSIQGSPVVVCFRDPETHSTCALFLSACTSIDDVRAALLRKREQFAEKV